MTSPRYRYPYCRGGLDSISVRFMRDNIDVAIRYYNKLILV